ncbi:cytochrome P450 [Aspergillus navahoensis]
MRPQYGQSTHLRNHFPVFYVKENTTPIGPSQMVLASPDAAELIAATESHPLHDKVRDYVTPLLGDEAVGASDGEKWKMLHHMPVPALRPAKTKSMANVIAGLVREWLRPALEEYAARGEVFSMEKCAARLVFGISSRAILGDGVSEAQNAQLLVDMNHIVEYATTLALTTATNPLVKAGRWWRKRAAIRRMDSFPQSFVQERMARFSTILDTILANAPSTQYDPRNPALLTPEFVRIVSDKYAPLSNLIGLLGGYGTTADTCETLRLFTVGFNARKAKPGSPTLTYKDTAYPTNVQMIIPTIYTIHYDATIPSAKAWRPFERGPRAFRRDLAMDELRIILLLTARGSEFECKGVDVESRPAQHTDLDLAMGDLAFQEMGFSAKAGVDYDEG